MKKPILSNSCFLWSMAIPAVATCATILYVDGTLWSYVFGIGSALIFAFIVYLSLDNVVEYQSRNKGTATGPFGPEPFAAYAFSFVALLVIIFLWFIIQRLAIGGAFFGAFVGIVSGMIFSTICVGLYVRSIPWMIKS